MKMDLIRNACLVAGGPLTDAPSNFTYVVSCESAFLAYLLASLNNQNMLMQDNLFWCWPGVWIMHAISSWNDKFTLCTKKSSRALWRVTLNIAIMEMGFHFTIANPHVYWCYNVKPDSIKYYKFFLVYVDDVLIVSHSPLEHLSQILACYVLNPMCVGPPLPYLGVDIEKVLWPGDLTGNKHWSFSADAFIQNAIWHVSLIF